MFADDRTRSFVRFLADEQPALAELKAFVGGEAANRLDGSAASLVILDTYLANLRGKYSELESTFAADLDLRTWLAVRLGYYFGLVLQAEGATAWYLSQNTSSPTQGTPVVALAGIELSPLEVAHAAVTGSLQGGFVGLLADFRQACAESPSTSSGLPPNPSLQRTPPG